MSPRIITFETLTIVLILVLIAIFTHIDSRQYMFEGFIANSNNDSNSNNDTKLILIHADWCGHCKKMKPEWDKIKSEFGEERCIDIESESITEEHRKLYKINGFPSLFKDKNGNITPYEGDRTYTAFREVLTQ
jgi:thiol-disulfide isomerase/thioredoxin